MRKSLAWARSKELRSCRKTQPKGRLGRCQSTKAWVGPHHSLGQMPYPQAHIPLTPRLSHWAAIRITCRAPQSRMCYLHPPPSPLPHHWASQGGAQEFELLCSWKVMLPEHKPRKLHSIQLNVMRLSNTVQVPGSVGTEKSVSRSLSVQGPQIKHLPCLLPRCFLCL